MRPEEIEAKLAAARRGFLGTAGRNGRPHLVPICFVLDGDTCYSAVDWKPKRTARLRRLENVREQPWATLLVDHYEEDWSRLWWVRLDGRAVVLESGREFQRALGLLQARYEQYRSRPPSGPVLKLAIERWSGWSAS